jgi:LysR family hydrogen peroxide-inducible transcriptional activator
MNLNQLRFVRAVADAGSFTAAAKRCCVTQSTLSTGIALLEKKLGGRLFVRTTRSVSLTPFGRRLLPLVDQMLAAQTALEEAAERWLDSDALMARIGVCPLVDSRRMEQILAPFRQANRDVRVVLEQLTGVPPQVALEEGQVDFILGPPELRRSTLERSRLYEDVLVYLPSGDLGQVGVGQRPPVRLEEIAGDTFLLVPDSCGLTALTRQLFRSRRLTLHQYEGKAVNYQVLEEWARVGVGSAILPRSKLSSPEIGHPIVLGNGHPCLIRFEAVWSSATSRPPHVQALARHFQSLDTATAARRSLDFGSSAPPAT